MYPSFREAFGWELPEPIPLYFAMLMTGFAVSIFLGARWAKRSKLDHDVIIDLGLVSLIAGVAGARILHVFVDGHLMDYVNMCLDHTQVAWPYSPAQCVHENIGGVWDVEAGVCRPPEGDCFSWAYFWQGGLVWYGGLIAAGFYGTYFLKKEGFPVLKGIDMAGMMIPLGIYFGRLGCWFGGCCFGVVDHDHWSAVSFPAFSPASEAQFRDGLLLSTASESLPVLPTQFYEAIGCLAVAAFCMFVVHPRKRFDGQVFVVSMAGYAIVRFLLEFLRADDRGAFLHLSTSQWIGIAIVLVMLLLARTFKLQGQATLARSLRHYENGVSYGPSPEEKKKKKRKRQKDEEE